MCLCVCVFVCVRTQNEGRHMQLKAANAVLELARKIDAASPIDCLPEHPEKTVRLGSQVRYCYTCLTDTGHIGGYCVCVCPEGVGRVLVRVRVCVLYSRVSCHVTFCYMQLSKCVNIC